MPRAFLPGTGISLRYAGSALAVFALGAVAASCGLDVQGAHFSSAASGSASTGSGGGGGGGVCSPGATRSCYEGPAEAKGVGECKAGTETCTPDGSGWSSCEGSVLPGKESCASPGDEDCDGMSNEGGEDCDCTPAVTMQDCYGGAKGTDGVGICKHGTQTCNAAGDGFDPCVGEVTPKDKEDCGTADVDDDCDGAELANAAKPYDENSGCICVPAVEKDCYSGPSGTLGAGVCKAGKTTCIDGKTTTACVGEVGPSNDDCKTLADEDCDGANALCSGDTQWSMSAGDGAEQAGLAVRADANDNVLVAGAFKGSITLGVAALASSQGYDVFLAKYDAAGAHKWSQKYGSSGDDEVGAIAVDAGGNVIAAGSFDGGSIELGGAALVSKGGRDTFVVKLDPAGNHLWSVGLGGSDDERATGVAVAPNGDVYVAGTFRGTPNFGMGALPNGGGTDLFLVKLASATGATLWSKGYGDAANQLSISVASDSAGNAILSGPLVGTVNFGAAGNQLDAKGVDLFVAKFTPMGGHAWSKIFGDDAVQAGQGVAVDGTSVVVSGYFQGVMDFGGGALTAAGFDGFVAKLDGASGNGLWGKSFGGANDQGAGRLAIGAAGTVIVIGTFDTSIDFGAGSVPVTTNSIDDGYVLRLDAASAFISSRIISGGGMQVPIDVAADTKCNFLLTGAFQQTLDLGVGHTHTSAGAYDYFIAKFVK